VNAHKTSFAGGPESRVILNNVSWETYERLVAETGDGRRTRLAYDRGTLEIMSPLSFHERCNWLLGQMFFILAEELEVDIIGLGQLTCRREEFLRGLEPDTCFYVKNAPLIEAKKDIDLEVDPPPDIMIEVDITNSSLNKFPIYTSLRVPEVWRFDGETLTFHVLRRDAYVKRRFSPTFPGLALGSEVPKFIKKATTQKPMPVLKEFRAWVKQHAHKK
jgi:Uma2 family endonuclease